MNGLAEDHERHGCLTLSSLAVGPHQNLGTGVVDDRSAIRGGKAEVSDQFGKALVDRGIRHPFGERNLVRGLQGAPDMHPEALLVDVDLIEQGVGGTIGFAFFDGTVGDPGTVFERLPARTGFAAAMSVLPAVPVTSGLGAKSCRGRVRMLGRIKL